LNKLNQWFAPLKFRTVEKDRIDLLFSARLLFLADNQQFTFEFPQECQ